jgi:hypothetical protein
MDAASHIKEVGDTELIDEMSMLSQTGGGAPRSKLQGIRIKSNCVRPVFRILEIVESLLSRLP